MKITQNYLTKNDCYKQNKKLNPKGIMLHSVGTPQPNANVFVKNWDKSGVSKCVHGFIDGISGDVVITLPYNVRGWHCGGKGNDSLLGFEMAEPDCITYVGGAKFTVQDRDRAIEITRRTYNSAVELFAMLCAELNLDPLKDGVILSHSEGHQRGIASNHADCEHLWRGLGLEYTMDGFRRDVADALKISSPAPEPKPMYYTVVKGDSLSKIGKAYGIPWKNIAELNKIKPPFYIIRIGQRIRIQ